MLQLPGRTCILRWSQGIWTPRGRRRRALFTQRMRKALVLWHEVFEVALLLLATDRGPWDSIEVAYYAAVVSPDRSTTFRVNMGWLDWRGAATGMKRLAPT
jgi:hypothetical protein